MPGLRRCTRSLLAAAFVAGLLGGCAAGTDTEREPSALPVAEAAGANRVSSPDQPSVTTAQADRPPSQKAGAKKAPGKKAPAKVDEDGKSADKGEGAEADGEGARPAGDRDEIARGRSLRKLNAELERRLEKAIDAGPRDLREMAEKALAEVGAGGAAVRTP
jgi:hypothetical protein